MTAVLSLADARALASKATARMDSYDGWASRLDRDRAAINSALRRMERHDEDDSVPGRCYGDRYAGSPPWPCPDYFDATVDLLRHCAPYTEVPI